MLEVTRVTVGNQVTVYAACDLLNEIRLFSSLEFFKLMWWLLNVCCSQR